jgi:hypothetical protein
LARDFAEVEGFSSRVAPAKQTGHGDNDEARLDEKFAAVEPVDGIAFQGGIGEKAMKEKCRRSEIDAEVERLPKMAAQPKTKIGKTTTKASR